MIVDHLLDTTTTPQAAALRRRTLAKKNQFHEMKNPIPAYQYPQEFHGLASNARPVAVVVKRGPNDFEVRALWNREFEAVRD